MSAKEDFKTMLKGFPKNALIQFVTGLKTGEYFLEELEKSPFMGTLDEKIKSAISTFPLQENEIGASLTIFIDEGITQLALVTWKEENGNTIIARNIIQVPLTQVISFILKISKPEEMQKLLNNKKPDGGEPIPEKQTVVSDVLNGENENESEDKEAD